MRSESNLFSPLLAALSIAVLVILLLPQTAAAVPAFSRQIGADCRLCHFMDMHGLTKFGREFKIHAFRETERMKAERKRLEERRKGAAGDRSEDQPPEDKQSVDNSPENQVGGQSPGKESE